MNESHLIKKWERSYDEDTADAIAFRPSSYQFKSLQRGARGAIEFKSDKTFRQWGDLVERTRNLAADDRFHLDHGTWSLKNKNIVTLHFGRASEETVYEVLLLSDDRLVLQTVMQ